MCCVLMTVFVYAQLTLAITGDTVDPPIQLAWIDTKSGQHDGATHVLTLSGDPSKWLRNSTSPTLTALPLVKGSVASDGAHLTRDPVTGIKFWNDRRSKQILASKDSTALLYRGTSDSVTGLAFDWLSRNVYWTDAGYNWIMMASVSHTPAYHRIVADTGIDKPSDIVVDPFSRYLFWSDSGVVPKIERSRLSGDERTAIIASDVWRPSAMTVDYNRLQIYWHEPDFGTLHRANYDGGDRWSGELKAATNKLVTSVFGLTVMQEYLYVSEEGAAVHMFNKTTLDHIGEINASPLGLSVTNNQTVKPSPCDNTSCQHICVNKNDIEAVCYCSLGYELETDGTSCKVSTTHHQPLILYVNDSSICALHHNAMDCLDTYKGRCIYNSKNPIGGLAYNAHADTVYFAQLRHIYKLRMSTGSSPELVLGEVGNIEGVAVDWISSLLYWTNVVQGTLSVSNLDGGYPKQLLDGLASPGAVAVDPIRKSVYFITRGSTNHIERCDLDGSRRSIVVPDIPRPYDVIVDVAFNKLFWSDIKIGLVESFDLNTRQRHTLVNTGGVGVTGITWYKDFLVWNTRKDMHFTPNCSETSVSTGSYTLKHVIAYDYTNQPLVNNACNSGTNGGCDQLCLPTQTGRTCECTFGFRKNGTKCLSTPMSDEFIFATDFMQQSIYQVGLGDTGDVRALKITPTNNVVALEYDEAAKTVYWTDVETRTIKRANIKGGDEKVIAILSSDSLPAGLAADFKRQTLFYADMGRHTISSISVDGTRERVVAANVTYPRAITICTQTRLLYFATQGIRPRICRLTYDGSHMKAIVTTSVYQPNGLAVDYEGHKLYWSDGILGRIESVMLDGTERTTVYRMRGAMIFDVFLHGQWLYFTEWTKGSIQKVNVHTKKWTTVVGKGTFVRPLEIFVQGYAENNPLISPLPTQEPNIHLIAICSSVISVCVIAMCAGFYLMLKWSKRLRKLLGIKGDMNWCKKDKRRKRHHRRRERRRETESSRATGSTTLDGAESGGIGHHDVTVEMERRYAECRDGANSPQKHKNKERSPKNHKGVACKPVSSRKSRSCQSLDGPVAAGSSSRKNSGVHDIDLQTMVRSASSDDGFSLVRSTSQSSLGLQKSSSSLTSGVELSAASLYSRQHCHGHLNPSFSVSSFEGDSGIFTTDLRS